MVGRAYPNDGHRAFPSTAKREFPIFGSDVAGPPVDSLFSDVSLLLHCNGSNASTTIIDDSSNGFTMVANGNAQLETAINKFGTASLLFDGTTDAVDTTSDDPAFTLGSGDFTIECFVYFPASPSGNRQFINQVTNTSNQISFIFRYDSGNRLAFYYSTSGSSFLSTLQNGTWSPSVETWYHVAVCRDGNNLRLFIDGTQVNTTKDVTGLTIFDSNQPLRIGGLLWSGSIIEVLDGNIDEVRMTLAARYTTNFTPPTLPFPDQ
jgi:hypothetical protein